MHGDLKPGLCTAKAAGGLACALLLAGPAAASDWWSISEGVNGADFAADASSLSCRSSVCTVWERTTYLRTRADGVARQTDLADYDCVNLKTRTRRELSYSAAGVLVRTRADERSAWFTVAPDTIGDSLMSFACTYRSRLSSAAYGELLIHGRWFTRITSSAAARPTAPVGTPAYGVTPKAWTAAAPTTHAELSATPAKPALASAIRPPPARPRTGEASLVQITAAPSASAAQGALDLIRRAQPALLGGRSTRVEPVTIANRRLFRALVLVPGPPTMAKTFCRQVTAQSPGCFVRPAGR